MATFRKTAHVAVTALLVAVAFVSVLAFTQNADASGFRVQTARVNRFTPFNLRPDVEIRNFNVNHVPSVRVNGVRVNTFNVNGLHGNGFHANNFRRSGFNAFGGASTFTDAFGRTFIVDAFGNVRLIGTTNGFVVNGFNVNGFNGYGGHGFNNFAVNGFCH